MPVYTYICSECGARFEQRRSFKDGDGNITCPNGHVNVRREYSAPSVVFKGSGWYSTDHRKKSTEAVKD
ncbi:FmdB family zinc ribbon protein [Ornatilinea apprima]|uniref:FmdB family zinc ribbon protein n=1 Tax=Ornatilinea apprima TaxID=1134406 RepID=UPI0009463C29|nr:FmdB family zinc ribbon protein [Ornatilinea apprima]